MSKEYKIPTGIEKEAKDYMQNVIDRLKETDIMQNVDSAALNMLAYNYSMYIKAGKELATSTLLLLSDRGNASPNPLIKIQKDAQTQAIKIMEKFGLTAKDRTYLTKMDNSEEEQSPLEQFVKQDIEER